MIDKTQLFELNPRDYIIQNRQNGKSDEIIYQELITRFSEKEAVYRLIKGTPTIDNKRRYGIYNKLLFTLLLITIVVKIIGAYLFWDSDESIASAMFFLLLPAVNILFAWGVYNYIASLYNVGGILALIGVVLSIINYQNSTLPSFAFSMIFGIAATILFFFLAANLFAKLSFSPTN